MKKKMVDYPIRSPKDVYHDKHRKKNECKSPKDVYQDGLKRLEEGKSPRATLAEEYGGFTNGIAFAISKLMENDEEDDESTLFGKPLLGKTIDWSEESKKDISGTGPHILNRLISGIEKRKCSCCYFRDKSIDFNSQKECLVGEHNEIVKKYFGLPLYMYLPEKIGQKEVGYYCPFWTDNHSE